MTRRKLCCADAGLGFCIFVQGVKKKIKRAKQRKRFCVSRHIHWLKNDLPFAFLISFFVIELLTKVKVCHYVTKKCSILPRAAPFTILD